MNIAQPLLPLQLVEDTSKLLTTSLGGLPLAAETFWPLDLRESVRLLSIESLLASELERFTAESFLIFPELSNSRNCQTL